MLQNFFHNLISLSQLSGRVSSLPTHSLTSWEDQALHLFSLRFQPLGTPGLLHHGSSRPFHTLISTSAAGLQELGQLSREPIPVQGVFGASLSSFLPWKVFSDSSFTPLACIWVSLPAPPPSTFSSTFPVQLWWHGVEMSLGNHFFLIFGPTVSCTSFSGNPALGNGFGVSWHPPPPLLLAWFSCYGQSLQGWPVYTQLVS